MTALPLHKAPFTELDALGQLCPWPLVLTKQALKNLTPGDELRVLCDDPMAELDLRALCVRDGHMFLGVEPMAQDDRATEAFVLRIVKAA
jgi:tRNA 2-thiouridine synthesizing protein A